MTGAEALVERLVEHGVDTVFGLPGEENLAVVEALADSPIEFVVTRHEQHAAFMAATHGRLTGRPGICLATLGPGATNLFTGLAHAELGGMPVVALTGQKPNRDNDEGSFQVVDVPAAARPITTWSTSIDDPDLIPAVIDEAMNRATSDRPGAVLVELPEDIAGECSPGPSPTVTRVATSAPSADHVHDAARTINGADHVVLLASAGAASEAASAALTAFAERTGIGVVATQLGKGAIAESHRLSYRSLGIHRPDYAHLALDDATVVVCVGYQPVEHPPLAWNPDGDKTVIHVAPWRAAIERGYRPAHQLVGDIAATLDALGRRVARRDETTATAIRSTIEELLAAEDAGTGHPPSPLAVVRTVRGLLDPADVVALDNGAYKIWFARHYRAEAPDTLLLDNALATMGAGLATAMEAARQAGGRRVLAVCGDGGFLMNVQDLETACRIGLDLTILVLRDDAYGFIAWHQDEQGRPRDGVQLGNPDLVALAKAFGARGHRVTEDDSLHDVLGRAFGEPGVSLVDCPIDYSINELLGTDLLARARAAHAPPEV